MGSSRQFESSEVADLDRVTRPYARMVGRGYTLIGENHMACMEDTYQGYKNLHVDGNERPSR